MSSIQFVSKNGRVRAVILQAAEELQGIHSIGIIGEAGVLGPAKWDKGGEGAGWRDGGGCCSDEVLSLTYDALDVLVTDEEGKGVFSGAVIFIVQYADGAKGGAGLNEEDGLVGHIVLFIQNEQGELVVVIVLVFGEFAEVIVPAEGFQQGEEVVFFGYIELGHVAAAQSEIQVYIVGQPVEVVPGLFACEDGHGSAIAADDMGVFAEIIIKIAG
jgi:hypothetical protein